jgi:hypothetical protein
MQVSAGGRSVITLLLFVLSVPCNNEQVRLKEAQGN